MNKYKEITTKELVDKIKDESVTIIDVRSSDAYNGWCLSGEKRSGHIKGSKSLPAKWTRYMDWIEIVQSKNIIPSDTIVIYANELNDIEEVAKAFSRADYHNLLVYKHFMDEWNADNSFPLEILPRYKYLVPPQWVSQLINGEDIENYSNDNFVICHAHYRNRKAYLSGHIPGAIDMDTLALESPETWNRRSPKELKQALEAHGITSDTTVVLYGKFMHPDNADDFPGSAAGHIGAIRNAMIMMYAGVKDVRIINGGYQSWIDEGYPVETLDIPKKKVKDFGADIPALPEIIVDIAQAKEMIAVSDADLVCVRSWPEYIGKVSGYNYIKKKGRIPGVIFGNCGTDAYHMENYRNVDHTIREAQEVEAIWKAANIVPEKHLAFYCGTGWRGSEAWYNAWLMNWPRVSVFDGGWFEWSNDPENPFETGLPTSKK